MKHSVFSPRGGRGVDEQTHTDHRQQRRARTGGPRRGRAARHACKKQTRREPGIHSDAVSFPKARLLVAKEKKRGADKKIKKKNECTARIARMTGDLSKWSNPK